MREFTAQGWAKSGCQTHKFDSAPPFSEGLAAVELNKRFGYISPDGGFVIPPKYVYAGPFSDGFAWVCTHKLWAPFGTGEYGVPLFARYTFVDRSGREIKHPFSVEYVGSFSEGLAVVRLGKIFGGCSNEVGYLNTEGEWAIKPQFDDARSFSDGLAAVNLGGNVTWEVSGATLTIAGSWLFRFNTASQVSLATGTRVSSQASSGNG